MAIIVFFIIGLSAVYLINKEIAKRSGVEGHLNDTLSRMIEETKKK